MKLKFFLLTFLLLFSRGCDFYSTSLWFFDNPTGEQNPLYQFFGVGWTGLIAANVLVVGGIIYAFYFYTFRYKPSRQTSSTKLTDFVSETYFNEKGRFTEVFYKTPKNKSTLLAHAGYVMVRVVIVGSFLATFHNICQFYDVSFYNTFREIVGRPLYVIYGLILSAFIYFPYRLWNTEYRMTMASGISIP
jgi:hypothetical protein